MRTASTDYWTGIRDSLTDLSLDWLRYKHLDLERPGDDRNIPDQADLHYGQHTAGQAYGPYAMAPGGLTWMQWLMVGGLVIGGVWFAKRVV